MHHRLLPLYLEYLDDHRMRLAAAGHDDLAAAFTAWRRELVDESGN